MLHDDVLIFVRKKGYVNVREISKAFNEPLDKIELILQQLIELGYLEYASNNCSLKLCDTCPINKSCPFVNSGTRFYKVKSNEKFSRD
ncbi:MAG: FeoC-like transcriptional regulator [Thermoprotei archaeon]